MKKKAYDQKICKQLNNHSISFIQACLESAFIPEKEDLFFFDYENPQIKRVIEIKEAGNSIFEILHILKDYDTHDNRTIAELKRLIKIKDSIKKKILLSHYLTNLSTIQKLELQCYRFYSYLQEDATCFDDNVYHNIYINRMLYLEAIGTSMRLFRQTLQLNTGPKPLSFNDYIEQIIISGKL